MGKLTIRKKGKKRAKVPYDQEMQEIREWQENLYNPGHYIGTGRQPYPLKNLSRRPKLKWLYLIYTFGPIAVVFFLTDVSLYALLGAALVIGVFLWIVYDSKKHLS